MCLQDKGGKQVWRASFTKYFGVKVPTWSYREPPLVDGDKIICTRAARTRRRWPTGLHTVIANGKLYVRDQDVLFCYDVEAQ